jgi:hypothetical protein
MAKNRRKQITAAYSAGVILLLAEADSLFGRRSGIPTISEPAPGASKPGRPEAHRRSSGPLQYGGAAAARFRNRAACLLHSARRVRAQQVVDAGRGLSRLRAIVEPPPVGERRAILEHEAARRAPRSVSRGWAAWNTGDLPAQGRPLNWNPLTVNPPSTARHWPVM